MQMEMSLQMHSKMEKFIPVTLHKTWSRKKAISCRANEMPMQSKKTNFYEVLSLGSNMVGFAEIKKAYRRLALQYHPDVCPASAKEEFTKRFVELREAYETLSNPISRRVYDYELGLVSSLGFSFEWLKLEERRNTFSRAVWERQLHGLKQKSHRRMERMNN